MTDTAYQIWEAFKAELTQPATDDMKEALATAILYSGWYSAIILSYPTN